MKIHNLLNVSFLLLFGVSSFAQHSDQKEPIGINTSYIDKKVRPNDDFFNFVNGTWVAQTDIPDDKTRWGSFDELAQNTNRDVLNILKNAATNAKYNANTDQGKAVNLYLSIIDTLTRNKNGITPLKPMLAKIDQVKNINDLLNLISESEATGGIGFFKSNVSSDAKNSNRHVLMISPGPLGLADQDYYISDDKDSKEKRDKYVLHVARMLQIIGDNPKEAKSNAEKVLAIETAMSAPRLNRVERRDSRKSYNPMTMESLKKLTPAINWEKYSQKAQLPKVDTLIVSQPKYMVALQEIFKKNDVSSWRAYLRWTLLNRSASRLSTDIETANWEFYGKTLTGAIQQRPLQERAVLVVNGTLGEAVGRLYVAEKFPPEAKQKAELMIVNVFKAFENRINNLVWMSPNTKVSAIEKLRKSTIKVGYPDTNDWKDYSKLTIVAPSNEGSYYQNIVNVAKWQFADEIATFYEPVDKGEWYMSPQTVNAYYSSTRNEIVFPAGILQPPFYDYRADEAVNYGGIGAVIGHEISHGFDDSGSRYDADGNLVNWWSDEDLERFTKLGGNLAAQYSMLEPLEGIFVDGEFTLGENIGDLGGVNAGYDGLQLHLQEKGSPGLIDGFTPEQRFFMSWATIWRTKTRDEAIKNQVKTDPHTPAMFRAYVPLQNVDAFYKAFKIVKGDGMYLEPEDRVKIW